MTPLEQKISEPYRIIIDPGSGRKAITCNTCGKTSHHPQDVVQRYCGYCHRFHDDKKAETKQPFLKTLRVTSSE